MGRKRNHALYDEVEVNNEVLSTFALMMVCLAGCASDPSASTLQNRDTTHAIRALKPSTTEPTNYWTSLKRSRQFKDSDSDLDLKNQAEEFGFRQEPPQQETDSASIQSDDSSSSPVPTPSVSTSPTQLEDQRPEDSLPADGLTLVQVEQLAIQTSPSLAQLTAQIESLHGKHVQTGLRPNPEFGYFGDYGHERSVGEQGVYWNREFVRGGKLELNREVVCREIQIAEQNLEIERLRVLTDVRTQFFELLVLQRRFEIAKQFAELSQQAVGVSQQLFEAEEIAEIALLQTKLQARNINVVVLQTETEIRGAKKRLAALIGMQDGSDEIRVRGNVEPGEERLDFETLLDELLMASPEISRAQATYARSRRNLDRQMAEQIPNIQVQTNVRHSYGNDDELVQFQIGRPIQVNNWNQGNIRSARAEIVSTAESVQRVERDLKQRYATTFQDYRNALVRIDQFVNEIIPNAQRVYELTAIGYRQGEIGYLDLILSQRLYFDAALNYNAALRDHWNAFALLDGYLLSGSLKLER